MSDLASFKLRVNERLTTVQNEPNWNDDTALRYMSALAEVRKRFRALAAHLIADVIRPRLKVIAELFPGEFTSNDPPEHCSCWLPKTDRFPSTTKIGFAVGHDARCEKLVVTYEMYMMPVFIKFNEKDRLTILMEDVKDDVVIAWTEDRLFEFLDSYMQIDRGEHPTETEVATDPVCGMRISRTEQTATASHCGHTYFFCSDECSQKFGLNPKKYVRVAMM